MNLQILDNTAVDFADATAAFEDQMVQEALEILDRRLFTTNEPLTSPRDVADYLKLKLAPEAHEVFAVIFLNSKHQPLAFEVLFRGSVDCATIHPRQIVKRALAHNAAAMIISHNHPSGCTDPSTADVSLTGRIKESLSLIDVRLLDHFVVGCGKPYSFAERGLL